MDSRYHVNLLTRLQAAYSTFRFVSLKRTFSIRSLLNVSARSRPSIEPTHPFLLDISIENVSTSAEVQVRKLSTLSPTWMCTSTLPFTP